MRVLGRWVLGGFVTCVLLAGCAVGRPAAQQKVEKERTTSGSPSGVITERPGDSGQAASTLDVKLVPYKGDGPPTFKLLHPEGWSVSRTFSGENVQISKDAMWFSVDTRQIQQQAPTSVEEMRQRVMGRAIGSNVEVKQVDVAGTVSAFELKYAPKVHGGRYSTLVIEMYGTAFSQSLGFTAAPDQFRDWEPIFRKMIKSFEHSDLERNPLVAQP